MRCALGDVCWYARMETASSAAAACFLFLLLPFPLVFAPVRCAFPSCQNLSSSPRILATGVRFDWRSEGRNVFFSRNNSQNWKGRSEQGRGGTPQEKVSESVSSASPEEGDNHTNHFMESKHHGAILLHHARLLPLQLINVPLHLLALGLLSIGQAKFTSPTKKRTAREREKMNDLQAVRKATVRVHGFSIQTRLLFVQKFARQLL